MHVDLIIIGAGPGGYVAAERAGAAGKSVLLIERDHLGGVCLNWGCVPTKSLLNSAKVYHNALHGYSQGIVAEKLTYDFGQAMRQKQLIIEQLRGGIAGLMKKYKVQVHKGEARLVDPQTVQVGPDRHSAERILIATGSRPVRPPIPGADADHVLDSTGILALEHPPEALTIVGGGVIGCEFACYFASIGVPVSVVEMQPEICPGTDPAIAAELRKQLEKKGVAFFLSTTVTDIADDSVGIRDGKGEDRIDTEYVLMSVGRAPNVEGLGLEDIGVATDRGRIGIDEHCRTNIASIYACGDVTGKVLLAHAASRQGEVAVNHMLGRPDRMRYHAIPGVIYTSPEVATVGYTVEQARAAGREVRSAKLPLLMSGRFLAENPEPKGAFLSIVVDARTEALIGMHMIGNHASEIVHAATAMIEAELRVAEIGQLCLAHPTVGELLKDAVLHLR